MTRRLPASTRTLTPLAFFLAAGMTGCSSDPVAMLATVQAQLQTGAFGLNVGEQSTVDLSVAATNAAVVDSIIWESTSPANLEIVNAPSPQSGTRSITVRGLVAGVAYVRVRVVVSNGAGMASATDSVQVTVSYLGVIKGIVRDSLNGPGLPDVLVRAIGATVENPPGVMTDAEGMYSIEVTEPDTYTMCAIGVIPPNASPQRFVNTNCLDEDVELTNASTRATLDLSIETGYYLGVTNGPFDSERTPGAGFDISIDYRAWIRQAVPFTTAWIAVGIEADAQGAGMGANAGHFNDPQPAASGTIEIHLTAPTEPGTYRIFARLIAVATPEEAMTLYESGYANVLSTNYAQLGTVTVN